MFCLYARQHNELSLRMLKTRDVLMCVPKGFQGIARTWGCWTIGHKKNKECRLGRLLTGMNRKVAIHMAFLLTSFTFTNTSCQSWSGGSEVPEKFVKPQGCSWILTQKWGSSGWKGQNSFRSILEGTAVLTLPLKKKGLRAHIRLGNLNPSFNFPPCSFNNMARKEV